MKLTQKEYQTIRRAINKGINTFLLAPDAELIERVLDQVLKEAEIKDE